MLLRRTGLTCAVTLALCQSVFFAEAPAPQESSWQALDRRTADLYAKAICPQAIESAQAALRIAASPKETGRSLDRLGFLYYTSGKLTEGETYLRRSLQTCEAAFGTDSLEYAEPANDLAMLPARSEAHGRSEGLRARAGRGRDSVSRAPRLPLAERPQHPGHGAGHVRRLCQRGPDVRALPWRSTNHGRGLSARRKSTGRSASTSPERISGSASTPPRKRRSRKGWSPLRVKPGVQHPAYAASPGRRRALKVDLGRYAEAERLYDEGARPDPIRAGRAASRVLDAPEQSGLFLSDDRQRRRRRSRLSAFAGAQAHALRPNSPATISSLRNLAHLTYARDHRAGEALLAEAVERTRACCRRSGVRVDERARRARTSAARSRRDRRGARHRDEERSMSAAPGWANAIRSFASAMRELGLTSAAAGQYDLPRSSCATRCGFAEEIHGPRHPDVAAFLDALGDFYVERRTTPRRNAVRAKPRHPGSLLRPTCSTSVGKLQGGVDRHARPIRFPA
jgi:hypothetical protein